MQTEEAGWTTDLMIVGRPNLSVEPQTPPEPEPTFLLLPETEHASLPVHRRITRRSVLPYTQIFETD